MSRTNREDVERQVALYLAHEVCGYPEDEAEIQASTTPFPEQAKDIVGMVEALAESHPSNGSDTVLECTICWDMYTDEVYAVGSSSALIKWELECREAREEKV